MNSHKETPSSKLDRQALLLFYALTICFAALAYIPIIKSGSLIYALDGFGMLLLMWSPGVAGLITALVMFRSVRPLGLGGSRKQLSWAALCLLLPAAYTLVIYPTLEAFGLIGLGNVNHHVGYFLIIFWPALLFSLGEEIGWRGFAAPV